MQKFIATILLLCGIAVLLAGLFYWWPRASVPHVAFGIVTMGAAVMIWLNNEASRGLGFREYLGALFWRRKPGSNFCDSKTNRLYRLTDDGDNPHHGVCPICHTLQRVIYTVYGKPRRYGVYCNRHNEQWFDLEV